jgi:hypothetical protein
VPHNQQGVQSSLGCTDFAEQLRKLQDTQVKILILIHLGFKLVYCNENSIELGVGHLGSNSSAAAY